MRIRRAIAAVSAGALLSVGLMACTGDGNAPTTGDTSSNGQTGEVVELKFWSWISGFGPVIDAYNESQDKIKVTYEETTAGGSGGYAKLSAALEAGNAADIVTVEYPMVPSYASTGGLLAIGDIIDDPKILEPYSEGVRSLVELGGKIWSLPYDAPITVYYYRADLFEKAGIEVPETWEEFEAAARKFKETFPDGYIASFFPNEPLAQLAGLAWQNEAKWFGTSDEAWQITINETKSQQVAQYWQRLLDDDLVKFEQVFSDEWAASLTSGTTAGSLGANWLARGIETRTEGQEGNWRVAPLPHYGTPATFMWGGSTFAVSKDSKNAEAAAEVIQWMTTSEEAVSARGSVGAAILADRTLNSVAKDNYDNSHFGGQDIYAVFEEATDSLVSGWTWGPTMTTLTEQLTDSLGQVKSGTKLEQVLENTQSVTVEDVKSLGLTVDE